MNVTAILQGITGGVIAAGLIGLMVPRTLSRRMSVTLGGPDFEPAADRGKGEPQPAIGKV